MTLETALMILAILSAVSVGGGLFWLGTWTGMKLSKGVWEIAKDNDFTSRPGQHVDSALPDVTE